MWVDELTIENIKGFEKINLRFSEKKDPVKWITLLKAYLRKQGNCANTFITAKEAIELETAMPFVKNAYAA